MIKPWLCASTAAAAWLLVSAFLAPAAAADLSVAPIYKAPMAVVPNWTGAYVGVAGGGAWGSAVVRSDVTGVDQAPRIDLEGGIIGVTAGFNVQNGPAVVGFEADTSAVAKRGSAFEFPPNGAFSNEVRERWLSTFRGRVGYAQDNWLFYATAGAAVADVHHLIQGPTASIGQSQWHWGLTAGGGVEVKLNPDWTAKVEYLYVGLQDKSYFNPAPTPGFPSNQRLNLDEHIVRVGVNYKLPWSVLDPFFKR
ncbi:MAG: outer membrane protein [Xanthobacteraceae bacterium]